MRHANAFPRGEGGLKSVHTWADFKTDEERRYVSLCMHFVKRKHLWNKRKRSTKEENLLWYNFLRLYKPQFRRQYVIGSYIVDFYCHKAKLVLELDGSQHCESENIEYDRARTIYLESQGLYVLRLSNLDVMRQFGSVCEHIEGVVKSRIPAP